MIGRPLLSLALLALWAVMQPAVATAAGTEIRFTFDDSRQVLPTRTGGGYAADSNAAAARQLQEIARDYGERVVARLVWTFPAGDGFERAEQRAAAMMAALGLKGRPVVRPGRGFGGNWLSVQMADDPAPTRPGTCGWLLEVDDPRLPPGSASPLTLVPNAEMPLPLGARYRIRAPGKTGTVMALGNKELGRSETWLTSAQRPLVLSLRVDNQVAENAPPLGGGKDRGSATVWPKGGEVVAADRCHVRLLPSGR